MQDDERQALAEWEATLPYASYYDLLGVDAQADSAEIRSAFHEFSRNFHPDAHATLAREDRQRLEHVFQRGVEAYRALIQPDLRANYDSCLARGELRLTR